MTDAGEQACLVRPTESDAAVEDSPCMRELSVIGSSQALATLERLARSREAAVPGGQLSHPESRKAGGCCAEPRRLSWERRIPKWR